MTGKTTATLTLEGLEVTAAGLGVAAIVAGGFVAAVDGASPFAHGAWLAAYLVLVAGVAQLVLAAGHMALRQPDRGRPLGARHVALWNLGNVAVAGGVLVDSTAAVIAGSVALLAALACFVAGVGRGRPGTAAWAVGYHALAAMLAASVLVGCLLAGAAPGGAA